MDRCTMQERYLEVLAGEGAEKVDLLRVLPQAVFHNLPHKLSMMIHVGVELYDSESLRNIIAERTGLVNRHVRMAQEALEEIKRVAEKRGYEDVLAIFNKEYGIGPVEAKPSAEDDSREG